MSSFTAKMIKEARLVLPDAMARRTMSEFYVDQTGSRKTGK